VSDFFYSFIPATFIFKIQVSLREKLVLYLLMGLGLVASIACIFKIVNSNTLKKSRDNTWDSVPLVIWGFVEQHLAIIAACIPCLKALFERLLIRVGIMVTDKSPARSSDMSMRNHTMKYGTGQDEMGGTAKFEDAAPGSGTWHKNGIDSHRGYDSEECAELGVLPAKME
jgi:hypothetical protein